MKTLTGWSMSFVKKIVIDTGTLISAALRAGSIPSQAYAKALRGYEICVSESTLAELDRVIRRHKFDAYLALQERIAFVDLYQSQAVCIRSGTWFLIAATPTTISF